MKRLFISATVVAFAAALLIGLSITPLAGRVAIAQSENATSTGTNTTSTEGTNTTSTEGTNTTSTENATTPTEPQTSAPAEQTPKPIPDVFNKGKIDVQGTAASSGGPGKLQLVSILPARDDNSMYFGTLTFTATKPILVIPLQSYGIQKTTTIKSDLGNLFVVGGASKGTAIAPAPFRPVYTDPADLRSGSDLALPDTFSASVPFAGVGLSVGTFDGTQFIVSYSVHADRVKATTMNNFETATAGAVNESATPKANITIADGQFQPGNLTITRGGTVVWLNNDDGSHTITSGMPNGTSIGTRFDSDYLTPQKTFEHRFGSTGNFTYFDRLNPELRGVITVVAPK